MSQKLTVMKPGDIAKMDVFRKMRNGLPMAPYPPAPPAAPPPPVEVTFTLGWPFWVGVAAAAGGVVIKLRAR